MTPAEAIIMTVIVFAGAFGFAVTAIGLAAAIGRKTDDDALAELERIEARAAQWLSDVAAVFTLAGELVAECVAIRRREPAAKSTVSRPSQRTPKAARPSSSVS